MLGDAESTSRSAQCALLNALCSMRSAQCALLNALCSLRSAHCALLNALNMPRAAFLCHRLRFHATGCVTCHGLRDMPRAAFLCERVAFLYLVPILGPWSFMVPYFVGRFALLVHRTPNST